MKILVIGSGGREHALVKALKRSASATSVVCSPGNAGIAEDVRCVSLATQDEMISYCTREQIDLVVVGPEQPLVEGLGDALRAQNIPTFGPDAKAAQLEASKDFTKRLCDRYHIPTARYASFTKRDAALDYIDMHGAPIVVKADGLAAGKGVTVAMTVPEARHAVEECFGGAFGAAGAKVVLEEYLEGEEVSFFALCDGERALYFASAQDHKRAFDGDTGPNTGGMGTYSPTGLLSDALIESIMETIIRPTVAGLKADGMPYRGVLFAGLMLTAQGPKLIEYNCRFGDPETQVMLARFNGDLAALLLSCANGKLEEQHRSLSQEAALCIVMAAKGYPGAYVKGSEIKGLEDAANDDDVNILHAGTAKKGKQFIANGGRVLNIVATGTTLPKARAKAYAAIEQIDWPEGFYRRDIGWRALARG